jgi:hypothetical protein
MSADPWRVDRAFLFPVLNAVDGFLEAARQADLLSGVFRPHRLNPVPVAPSDL